MTTASAIDAALEAVLRPGQRIVAGQAFGMPRHLIEALPRHLDRLQGSSIFLGWVIGDFPELPGVRIETFFPSGPFASEAGMAERNARYSRMTLHELTDAFASGSRPVDVVLAQATPARDGRHSLGVTVDFIHAAATRAASVVLETSPLVPWTGPASTIAARPGVIAVDVPGGPMESTPAAPRDDAALATNLIEWIPDGATLEFGIGQWFPPLIRHLAAARKGLRLHTGQIGPWIAELIAAGAINPQGHVGTGAVGDADFYAWLDSTDMVELAPASFTHDPARLAGLPKFRAINSVYEVDLLGRANSELSPSGVRGGIAGLPDFARGAVANPQGLSIVALAATARGISRIVPHIACAPPSLDSGEIDVVVTEIGSADLRGLSPAERAEALIGIAAEEYRPMLRAAIS
ncbi:acetyl-CoA hydrolase/transferase C-terminal domain-containing protein [Sphingomonas sp. AOB5]|uniref:acetyl-CoA hydrolase/transferase C-terminal domain-containing protein n=1 Tax=Sphingomonas sp. AOB5 TaxID=3034017 RepID=UPI0023F8C091|nr:acetyl-CoA hydrolase/transferase C-terminal domain-containing protein [Sphingomonas sp. AOB5]MDF7774848.1 acetyl-CoA hydrolase/transferase C-terminal domain-containing protein [Sphingomonas sp. AOB5]